MIEIAGLKPEEQIRGEGHHRRDRAEKFQPLRAEQIVQGWYRRQRHHHVQRGQQAACPALVESRKGERSAPYFRLNDPGDEVTGDHEEDIDADKTAKHRRRFEMERDHREYRDGAQPVDVLTIGAVHNGRAASDRRPVARATTPMQIMKRVRPS
jgi:hypothetical protein